jgi:hypothetical protein
VPVVGRPWASVFPSTVGKLSGGKTQWKGVASPVLALGVKALRCAPGPRSLLPRLERGILGEHHPGHAAASRSDGAGVTASLQEWQGRAACMKGAGGSGMNQAQSFRVYGNALSAPVPSRRSRPSRRVACTPRKHRCSTTATSDPAPTVLQFHKLTSLGPERLGPALRARTKEFLATAGTALCCPTTCCCA